MTYQEVALPALHRRLNRLRKALEDIASLELHQHTDAIRDQANTMQILARKALEEQEKRPS